MTKFEISDAMLNAAEQAYDTIAAIEHDAWCYTAPTRAAITAAIEASGLVEENARLRAENRELRIFATDIVNKRWDFFYPIEKAVETASFDFFKHVNSKFQALNKEPKP